jgi:hypothetical protein
MAQTISLMEPAQAQIRPKAFEMSINKEALTGTNLAFPTLSVALAWMFDVPEAGADCVFSIEERISRGDRNTASATVGRMLSRSQRAFPTQSAHGKGEVVVTAKRLPLQRYLWARNAPYALKDRGNLLKLHEMRAPSERTILIIQGA